MSQIVWLYLLFRRDLFGWGTCYIMFPFSSSFFIKHLLLMSLIKCLHVLVYIFHNISHEPETCMFLIAFVTRKMRVLEWWIGKQEKYSPTCVSQISISRIPWICQSEKFQPYFNLSILNPWIYWSSFFALSNKRY